MNDRYSLIAKIKRSNEFSNFPHSDKKMYFYPKPSDSQSNVDLFTEFFFRISLQFFVM